MRLRLLLCVCICAVVAVPMFAQTEAPPIEWIRQFGSSSGDIAQSVAVDASGVYVAGRTMGALPGQTKAGFYDAYIRKYDPSGTELWTRQFGSSGSTNVFGVAL